MEAKESYWQQEASWCDRWAATPVPAHADFVIVGGGFSGLATALQLRVQNPDASIVLLEAERVGYGASGRNAGFLSPVAAPIWLLGAHRSQEQAWAVAHVNRRMHETAAWIAEEIPEAEVGPSSLSIEGASVLTDAGLREFSKALGFASLPHTLAPSRVHGGRLSLQMETHSLHPYRLVVGLAERALTAGVTLCERQRVSRIEGSLGGARLTLARGQELSAGQVILCTNAYSRGLQTGERLRAWPVHSFMAATTRLQAQALQGLVRDADFTVELNAGQSYHRFHKGRILYGGTDSLRTPRGGDFAVPAPLHHTLTNDLRHSYPELQTASFAALWSGRLHATATGLPIIRRSTKNPALTLNVGYGGTGIALALLFAPVVAATASGKTPTNAEDLRLAKLLQATRFPPLGDSFRAITGVLGSLGKPWLKSLGIGPANKHL